MMAWRQKISEAKSAKESATTTNKFVTEIKDVGGILLGVGCCSLGFADACSSHQLRANLKQRIAKKEKITKLVAQLEENVKAEVSFDGEPWLCLCVDLSHLACC